MLHVWCWRGTVRAEQPRHLNERSLPTSPRYPTTHPDILYGAVALLQEEILADLLEASARRAPEQVALVFEGCELSFLELDRLADLAASRLIDAGVRPGHMLGLWMERGIDLLVMQAARNDMPCRLRFKWGRLTRI
jgi:non-ribosomal peptide synthetase component F